MKKINVLDNGYVSLVDSMGSDLSVVNAARVSFNKEHEVLTEGDEKLIKFLLEHEHASPFRHAFVTLEVCAPLFVARQWWKHVVGSDHTMDGWNEVSRRYVSEEPVYYIPEKWRLQAKNKKQGSRGDLPPLANLTYTTLIENTYQVGTARYESALKDGVAVEQARLFLPAYGMYTSWRWSASLQSVLHFLELRKGDEAQWEIKQYAKAVTSLVEPLFPVTFKVYNDVK